MIRVVNLLLFETYYEIWGAKCHYCPNIAGQGRVRVKVRIGDRVKE